MQTHSPPTLVKTILVAAQDLELDTMLDANTYRTIVPGTGVRNVVWSETPPLGVFEPLVDGFYVARR